MPYSIRYYADNKTNASKPVGFKRRRITSLNQARSIVNRLRKSGVEAYITPKKTSENSLQAVISPKQEHDFLELLEKLEKIYVKSKNLRYEISVVLKQVAYSLISEIYNRCDRFIGKLEFANLLNSIENSDFNEYEFLCAALRSDYSTVLLKSRFDFSIVLYNGIRNRVDENEFELVKMLYEQTCEFDCDLRCRDKTLEEAEKELNSVYLMRTLSYIFE